MNIRPDIQGAKPIRNPFARGLDRVSAAEHIGVSASTFDKMVAEGLMPKPKKPWGNRKVWDRVLLDKYFERLPSDEEQDLDDKYTPEI